MTPSEIWDWVDSLDNLHLTMEESLEGGEFFSIWNTELLDEILQGRGIMANVSFDGGLLLSGDSGTLIYRCVFNKPVSAMPLKLA